MKLPKVYEPSAYEGDIYALWEKSQAFTPSKAPASFSVVVPPPNANGNLHLGHGLTLAIEDLAVRYHRMKGEAALLLPGADHAGFETQVVYEKELAKQGKSRFDFTREELYKQIWDFVALNRDNFEDQLRSLGAGVDWTRFTFTLDEKIIKRTHLTFKKMWDEGLIYRGERLVNYCTFHRTGFADIEVQYEDTISPLYYIKYGPFTLATTRPETKFGDTAVAVHPDDERYKEWVGKTITVEGVNGSFEVRVVADEMVDPNFGTGAVKVTPAHSFDDWEVAQRHNLQAVRVINHDGTMNHHAGRFEGMTVMEARKAVAEAMEEKGLLVKVDENYQNRVGKCYKCGTVIEPMLMEQWFVDMQPLARPAIAALKADKIAFYPEGRKQQLITYLEGVKDWNISRQIAWGIPIPAFQNVDDSDDWIFDERVDQEIMEVDGKTYRRDPDVFDTWFSSGSWPYSTLNFGQDGDEDFEQFYPLSMMETGFDILYPWVSRMLMLGLYITGDVPFKSVYLHGLVLDAHGQKMSKSKGNVLNPADIVDKYGSDAFRMGILTGQTPGTNQAFGEFKVIAARNFCNKLWNIARFIEGRLEDKTRTTSVEPQTDADHWMMTILHRTAGMIALDIENCRFAEAYDKLYHFVWDDFADWYLEASKATENLGVLTAALEATLKIAHPFAPFVTETIWQTLGWSDELLVTSHWPETQPSGPAETAQFEVAKEIVSECRAILKAVDVKNAVLELPTTHAAVSNNTEMIKRMAHITDIHEAAEPNGLQLVAGTVHYWLGLTSEDIQRYADQLEAKRASEATNVKRLEDRLANADYVAKAPADRVEQTRQELEWAKDRLATAEAAQARLGQ